jgi:hypothetical protein
MLSLFGQHLNLIGRHHTGQLLIGLIKLVMELLHFGLEHREFLSGVLRIPQAQDGLPHFVGIHLNRDLHPHDHVVPVHIRRHLLIQHQHHAGCVGSDFIARHVKALGRRLIFDIDRDLFQHVSLGLIGSEADGILPPIPQSQPMLPLGRHHLDLRPNSKAGHSDQEAAEGLDTHRLQEGSTIHRSLLTMGAASIIL